MIIGRRRRESRYREENRNRLPSPLFTDEKKYSISANLGGFGVISIPWGGTSWEDARDSFLEYLENDEEFNDTGGRYRNRRSLYVKFYGRWKLLTFRTDWVSGFTVH